MTATNRREFIRTLGLLTAGTAFGTTLIDSCTSKNEMFFQISLAEWSLHRALFANKMTNLDFPVKAKNDFGISAVEYVNQFFKDKAKDTAYLSELKKRCDDNGVSSVLIMIDGEGSMGDLNPEARQKTVENHYRWVDAAKFLGCHSIRVNCYGEGTREDVGKAGADGLRKLSEYGKSAGINIIVENHGGMSSDGQWLSGVIKSVGMDNCGTLPDFGNFCIRSGNKEMGEPDCAEFYDRYKGVEELMPFAKGVSAKTYNFDEQGNCIETDYARMIPIVKSAGYTGRIGIEYEGDTLSEEDGIRATKKLLERVGVL